MIFSHLHVHTQFSLLDGAADIKSLYKKAMASNQPALAITDHGNMFGAFQFVAEAYNNKLNPADPKDKRLKVKPIVGCEFYVVENRHKRTFTRDEKDIRYHQVLLAKDDEGYRNLIKLCSLGYIEGLYGKYPRIDKELVLQYHKGLIATTCCLGASVPKTILKHGEEAGEKEFRWWLDIFGEDFYVELQRHGIPEQDQVNVVLLRFAEKYNVKVIASNDSHYVDQSDANAHDILLCINTGEKKSTPTNKEFSDDESSMKNRRFAFYNDQFYFKTTEEMTQLFHDLPQAIDNTNEIVDKVQLLDLKRDILLPNFPIPKEFLTQDQYLRHLTFEGAHKRYAEMTADIEERLNFELQVIENMGFAGYFLIVADFIKAGRDLGVFIGPGRGSAAGSAVAYCIGITNIDPIKYNLLFERFLNPERKSMPDIDTDFDDEGRQKVIDYVVQKYGKNQVAQIITYGTMAAKMSIKDVARVMDLPLQESNSLAKLVPDKPGIQLDRIFNAPLEGEKSLADKEGLAGEDIENVKRLRELIKGDDLQGEVLREACVLEGSVRNTGIHAAGIIIAPQDLYDLIPVSTAKDSDLLVTQFEGSIIESAGVIKMDFLGLKTLTIIKGALEMIRQNHGVDIEIDYIPLDDAKTYELYQRGETNATFQFESPGMQKYLRELKPDRFEDLIAMNALYRPGPLEYIPSFIRRKHGLEPVQYDIAEMEEYLNDTYGITVYQEQVMLLSQKLAGFSKGDADVLRKAMGKKQIAVLNKMKEQFMQGCAERGHDPKICEKVWTDWEAFASYAFNKSHSTCYAFVAYQTAYLKAHYPAEYMASVLNCASNIEKITFFMEECKRMGIDVLPPDVNESFKGFAVNKQGQIRFGLGGLKGVGEAAIENLLEERKKEGPFTSVFNFIKRVNQRAVNKKSLEALVMSGAFDCFPELHRAQYFHKPETEQMTGLDKIVKFGQQVSAGGASAMGSLFGDEDMPDVEPPKIPNCDPWPLIMKLNNERDITGIYISGHPLDDYRFELKHYQMNTIQELLDYQAEISTPGSTGGRARERNFRLAVYITSAQERISRNNRQFGVMTIEDYTGKFEFALWSEDFIRFGPYLKPGLCLFINGGFKSKRFNDNEYEFKVNSIQLLQEVKKTHTKQIYLNTMPQFITRETVDFLVENVNRYPGTTTLHLTLTDRDLQMQAKLHTFNKNIEMNDELAGFLHKQPDIDVYIDLNNK
ncbi:DNA polymerase-3 subunit alpha [Chitinophaga terrae (ex Kim and Jung 2007)]|uniref:DNA polymerase III subunit alpha n=1 Tax=Chitinophaga terrae (ex Kim and Jung 2007) TaxID=408074 RepID=A0A1H4AJ27_9BACT|nr:DNA polymerase III subunit alpha [Chitinophaga terrae (ex Kim and Jung 2007)]GEP89309.1 DNA-directed DNA polymerase [Chitinophaga terrae (ex Kim and Jung 2007)]SEA35837.1 DNA polymerase-3 subunit alpha [Chitinophaga terrae (ex Kim and Jung 2007)]